MHSLRQYFIVRAHRDFFDDLALIDGLPEPLILGIRDAFNHTRSAPITVDSFLVEMDGDEYIATPLKEPFRSRYIGYKICNEYIVPFFIGRTPPDIMRMPSSR